MLLRNLSLAAIALGTVQGRSTDNITLGRSADKLLVSTYEWDTDCSEPRPKLGAGTEELELFKHVGQSSGRSKCMVLGDPVNQIKFSEHHNLTHNYWVDDAAKGRLACTIRMYRDYGCQEKSLIDQYRLPSHFNRCYRTYRLVYSVDWMCEDTTPNAAPKSLENETPTTLGTAVKQAEQATSAVAVLAAREDNNDKSDSDSDSNSDDDKKKLVPRKQKLYNLIGVWYKHPWRDDDVCYRCWTKKELDFQNFQCAYGGHGPHPDCGTLPELRAPRTLTVWAQATETAALVLPADTLPSGAARVDKRLHDAPTSRVLMTHPWLKGIRVCAKAKWDHFINHGERNIVKIYNTKHAAHKCHKKKTYDIDVDVPDFVTATNTHVKTVYKTYGLVSASPSAVPQ